MTSLAMFGGGGPIRVGSDQDEASIAAQREAKEADTFEIDLGPGGRRAKREIDQALDVGRYSTKAERKRLISKVVSPR